MTLLDVQRLSAYWRQRPPLRSVVMMVGSSFGIKWPEIEEARIQDNIKSGKYMTQEQFAAMVRATDGGRGLM